MEENPYENKIEFALRYGELDELPGPKSHRKLISILAIASVVLVGIVSLAITIRNNNLITISFNADGGSSVEDIIIDKGSTIKLPVTTRAGYEFEGWYRNGTKVSAYKTTHKGDLHTASVRDWGQFTLMADTTAPTIRPVNFSEGKPLKATTLKIRIGDNLAGVETYSCYLNGSWILAEYDGKTAALSINAGGKLRKGSNELIVDVTDGCGNHNRKRYTLAK